VRPLRLPWKAPDLGCLAAFADTGGGLDLFAAFWLLGGRSDQAFFPHPGLPGTTRRFRGATLARLVDFRGCTVAAGGLACSSAFDVVVLKPSRRLCLPERLAAGGSYAEAPIKMTGVYLLGESRPMRAILRVNWPDWSPFIVR
jgi:hypothetical protein